MARFHPVRILLCATMLAVLWLNAVQAEAQHVIAYRFASTLDAAPPAGGGVPETIPRELFGGQSAGFPLVDMLNEELDAVTVTWADPAKLKTQAETEALLRKLLNSRSTRTWTYHVWHWSDGPPEVVASVDHSIGKPGKLLLWSEFGGYWAYQDGKGQWWWGDYGGWVDLVAVDRMIKITFFHPAGAAPYGAPPLFQKGSLPEDAMTLDVHPPQVSQGAKPFPNEAESRSFAEMVDYNITGIRVMQSRQSQEEATKLLHRMLVSTRTRVYGFHVWSWVDGTPSIVARVSHRTGEAGELVYWADFGGYWAYRDGAGRWWWCGWGSEKR